MDEEGKNKWLKMQDGNTNTETFFPPPSSSTNIPGVEHEAQFTLPFQQESSGKDGGDKESDSSSG